MMLAWLVIFYLYGVESERVENQIKSNQNQSKSNVVVFVAPTNTRRGDGGGGSGGGGGGSGGGGGHARTSVAANRCVAGPRSARDGDREPNARQRGADVPRRRRSWRRRSWRRRRRMRRRRTGGGGERGA